MKLRQADMLILGFLVIAATGLFGALNPRQFLSVDNIQSMAFQIPELGILSLGMMIAMLSGGINLSLIANANLFSVTSMIVFRQLSSGGTLPATPFMVIVSAACGLAAALGVGLLNGFLIAFVDVSPVLATLGSMTLVSGINILLTKGYTFSGVPAAILTMGNGTVRGVPIPLIVLAVSALLMALILNRTIFGYSTYMYGSNPQATRYSGINNRLLIIRVYLLSSVFAVLAALIMMGRFNSAKADYGESYLLITVLAGVLGGVDPSGGFGRVLGVMLALVILQIILSGLNLLRINPNLSLVIWGGILIGYMGLKYIAAALRVKRGISSLKS
jgi:simple sugar transport system permease protein